MELYVLDKSFRKIYVLDEYESLMWIDRYNKPGEFELYAAVTEDLLTYPQVDYYLKFDNSDRTMIIEDISIESNTETGNHIKIVGRSLESILDRRIVWAETSITGNLENGIKKLLYQNIIGGTGSLAIIPSGSEGTKRKISNFKFQASTDARVTALTMDNQYTGDNLLDVIDKICEEKKLGYKVILNDNNEFVFSLYLGEDRSYSQDVNPYVVFSPAFENIISSNYIERHSEYKNLALVAGEGEGTSRVTQVVGTTTGLPRRELYVDARDIRRDDLEGSYTDALITRGKEKLADKKVHREFDGKCETTQLYVYGKDFKMGDIVQVANEYGIESPSMITEFIWNHSATGIDAYPTFTAVEEE